MSSVSPISASPSPDASISISPIVAPSPTSTSGGAIVPTTAPLVPSVAPTTGLPPVIPTTGVPTPTPSTKPSSATSLQKKISFGLVAMVILPAVLNAL
ncbi:hypothetical protein EC991_010344 [Linnemannia zychae]|nr:hypothetical protein EC991_010344 [Linnemannia zychae]